MTNTVPVQYSDLKVGDAIDCGNGRIAHVIRLSEKWVDRFGREMLAHWCADEKGNEGYVPFGEGGIAMKIG